MRDQVGYEHLRPVTTPDLQALIFELEELRKDIARAVTIVNDHGKGLPRIPRRHLEANLAAAYSRLLAIDLDLNA